MATVKVDHVYEIMRREETPFWRITDNTGVKNRIDENDGEENVESAISLLENCIDMIEDNVVCIMLSNKTRKEKSGGGRGFKQFEFKINLGKGAQPGFGGGGAGMFGLVISQMEKNAELMRELALQKKEEELNDIKRDLKELKEGGKGKGWEMALPYLEKIFAESKGTSIASAGEDDDEVDADQVKAQQKIRKALKTLYKVDKNLPDTLTDLAAFAVKNPEKYKSMLPMLKAL